MKKSPADGFPIGAECGTTTPPTKPWPKLEIDASVDQGVDRFRDGASSAIPDVFEGDRYVADLTVKNAGDAVAKDVVLGVWIEEPFVVAERWDIETDWTHPGKFEPSDANEREGQPPREKPGQRFSLKINALSAGETKRVRLAMRAAEYSIGRADGPDVRVWVESAPGVYTKSDFGAKAENVENRQTWNGGDLKAWAPVDVYSRVRWSFDGGLLEGWSGAGGAAVDAADAKAGLVATVTAASSTEDAGEGPQLLGPETRFEAATWSSLSLRAASTLAGTSRVYFATEDAPGFDPSRAVDVVLPASSAEVVVRLADHPAWKGTITRLRIDPAPGSGTVTFDEIRLGDGSGGGGGGGGGGGAPAADAGPAAQPSPAEAAAEGGCGCAVPRRSPGGLALGWVALLALLARRSFRDAATSSGDRGRSDVRR